MRFEKARQPLVFITIDRPPHNLVEIVNFLFFRKQLLKNGRTVGQKQIISQIVKFGIIALLQIYVDSFVFYVPSTVLPCLPQSCYFFLLFHLS